MKFWSVSFKLLSDQNVRMMYQQIYTLSRIMCSFDDTAVAGSGTIWPVLVNHTSWMAVVTLTDRPKSVRNRCVIELFLALFVWSVCPFDISADVGAFVMGLSQISSLVSYFQEKTFYLDGHGLIM